MDIDRAGFGFPAGDCLARLPHLMVDFVAFRQGPLALLQAFAIMFEISSRFFKPGGLRCSSPIDGRANRQFLVCDRAVTLKSE